MADKVRVSDLDFVYISYKEPNKEENWADLLSKVPWAKRVDGVKGFDSAHKAAAEKAETDFYKSVDGDNTRYKALPEYVNLCEKCKRELIVISTNLNDEQINSFMRDVIDMFYGTTDDIFIATTKIISK